MPIGTVLMNDAMKKVAARKLPQVGETAFSKTAVKGVKVEVDQALFSSMSRKQLDRTVDTVVEGLSADGGEMGYRNVLNVKLLKPQANTPLVGFRASFEGDFLPRQNGLGRVHGLVNPDKGILHLNVKDSIFNRLNKHEIVTP